VLVIDVSLVVGVTISFVVFVAVTFVVLVIDVSLVVGVTISFAALCWEDFQSVSLDRI
jgi:hypothetical protein